MRSLVLGNGSFLVALDRFGEVGDLFFPYIGLEDHVPGTLRHHIGVHVDGTHSWLSEDPAWEIIVRSGDESSSGHTLARHDELGVELLFNDIVHPKKPLFMRNIAVRNLADHARTIKVYMGQQFEISQSQYASTGYFDPFTHSIIHYRGQRAFLINGTMDGKPLSDYAVGLLGYDGKVGTHVDAEDGQLSQNPVEHGAVDSVIGFYDTYGAQETKIINYWLAAGTSIAEATALDVFVKEKTPDSIIKETIAHGNTWVNRFPDTFSGLTEQEQLLFKKSLMIMRAHIDDHGGIIASADSDQLNYGKDTYAYVWMRDGSYVAHALDRAGYYETSAPFFHFAHEVIAAEGFFMHKYLPDGSLGSSWHPWIKNGIAQLPIQEDETASVIFTLADHYRRSGDRAQLEAVYDVLVERAADFMVDFRDPTTNLPRPSYDLWEEHHGVSTYTAASVYGALTAAAELASVLGKKEKSERYTQVAIEIREAILEHLYDEETGTFVKRLNGVTGKKDFVIDMSAAYGVFFFGVLPVGDLRLQSAFDKSVAALRSGDVGVVRYEHDGYYATANDLPNPWFVTTLWWAEFLIARATCDEDLEPVRIIFSWVAKHALPSGILSEQVHPASGLPLSVSPLVWSHAAYVATVMAYVEKRTLLGQNPTGGHVL